MKAVYLTLSMSWISSDRPVAVVWMFQHLSLRAVFLCLLYHLSSLPDVDLAVCLSAMYLLPMHPIRKTDNTIWLGADQLFL